MQSMIKASVTALALLGANASFSSICPSDYTLYTPTHMSIDKVLLTYTKAPPYFGISLSLPGGGIITQLISEQLESNSIFCINQKRHAMIFPPDSAIIPYTETESGFQVEAGDLKLSFSMNSNHLNIREIYAGSKLMNEIGRKNIQSLLIEGDLQLQPEN